MNSRRNPGRTNLRAIRTVAALAVVIQAVAFGIAPARAANVGYDSSDTDRFNLAVGGYIVTHTNGQIRLDQSVGPLNVGTSIDWGRDLGGETTALAPRMDGFYRFTPKHRVDFSWYNLDRDGTVITTRDLSYGNANFPAGTPVSSTLSSNTAKLAYTYSFYRAPEIETGMSLGLHVTQLKASIAASGLGLAESTSTTAPLPVFGFRLDYALTPKWWVRSKYELFFLDKIEEYRGSLNDFSLAIEHKTFDHVGFGFGFNRNSLELEVNTDSQRSAFNTVTSGFMLYVVVR